MAVLVTFTIGLVFWVTAWSFGVKSFDAFLVTVLLTVGAAAFVMVKPFVDKMLRREAAPPADRSAAV